MILPSVVVIFRGGGSLSVERMTPTIAAPVSRDGRSGWSAIESTDRGAQAPISDSPIDSIEKVGRFMPFPKIDLEHCNICQAISSVRCWNKPVASETPPARSFGS